MSKYLDRLRTLEGEATNPQKTETDSFGSFGSDSDRHVSNFDSAPDKSSATPSHNQSPDIFYINNYNLTISTKGETESTPTSDSQNTPPSTTAKTAKTIPLFDPVALQRAADRRNAEAARNHLTDRFCRCGHLAEFAWPGDDGRDVWICQECAPTRGRS